jgi:hypothetical protein
MFDHDLDSFWYALISLVRVGAAASLLALVWYGVAFLRKPVHRAVAIGAVVVLAMSATHFARTHICASGETDTDDYGRRFFRCTEWLPRRDPHAVDVAMGVGVLCSLALAVISLFHERANTARSLERFEQRLDVLESRRAPETVLDVDD